MEYPRLPASVCLYVSKFDHLAPLLGFVGDELAEIGGRADERRAAEFGEPRLDLGMREAGVDLMVEPSNDLGRRVLGRTDCNKCAGLEARQELAQCWHVWELIRGCV